MTNDFEGLNWVDDELIQESYVVEFLEVGGRWLAYALCNTKQQASEAIDKLNTKVPLVTHRVVRRAHYLQAPQVAGTTKEEGVLYESWFAEVNSLVYKGIGISAEDLPDVMWRDWYDDQLKPSEALEQACEEWEADGYGGIKEALGF